MTTLRFFVVVVLINCTEGQMVLQTSSNGSLRDVDHVPISVFGLRPFVRLCNERKSRVCGVDANIVDVLADKLGFQIDFKLQKSWGNNDSGTIGSVVSGDSLLGMGQLTMSWSRYQSVDFSVALYPMNLVLLSVKPRPLSPLLNILRTFTEEVWMSVVITTLALILLLSFFSGLSTESRSATFLLTALLTAQSLCPMPRGSRSFWSLCLFFSSMTVMAFKSTLLVNLMLKQYEPEVRSLSDAYLRNLPLYITNGSNLEAFVAGSPLPVVQKLYSEAVEKERYYYTNRDGTLIESLEREWVRERGVGVTIDTIFRAHAGYWVDLFSSPPFNLGQDILLSNYGCLMMPRHLGLGAEINPILSRLVDSGIIEMWIRQGLWSSQQYEKTEDESKGNEVIHLEHVLLGFLIWTMGMTGGFVALAIELMAHANRLN